MIKQLRLEKGWSQEHLAEVSGLSVRTVQRLERGQTASLESQKALAAVFGIELSDLQTKPVIPEESNQQHKNSNGEEREVIAQVQSIKKFYSSLITFCVVVGALLVINLVTAPNSIWVIWPALIWGILIALRGLRAFRVFNWLGPDWEKSQVEKRLGRK